MVSPNNPVSVHVEEIRSCNAGCTFLQYQRESHGGGLVGARACRAPSPTRPLRHQSLCPSVLSVVTPSLLKQQGHLCAVWPVSPSRATVDRSHSPISTFHPSRPLSMKGTRRPEHKPYRWEGLPTSDLIFKGQAPGRGEQASSPSPPAAPSSPALTSLPHLLSQHTRR